LALAERLQKHGEFSTIIYSGKSYEKAADGHYYVNPAEPLDFQRLLQENFGDDILRGVIHLWSLDGNVADLHHAQRLGCASVLLMVQSLMENISDQFPRLWLVTMGSQPVGTLTPLEVQQSPLWGLGKVIALEYPVLHCVCLDMDPTGERDDNIHALFEEIVSFEKEDQVAWRQGIRYVPRLSRAKLERQRGTKIRQESSYLITGGLGALGLKVTHWLVEHGAQYLILMGRHGASDEVQATLNHLGVQVLVVKADVSRQEEVVSVLETIKNSMPPLRGIIHAAGILDDGVLQQQTWERFSRVMAPKVEGAWNLHVLTQEMELDFFVCFSSMASLLGSPAQGNYVVANTFMDALAHHRRALGLPGLSINWGPWAEVGMAAKLGKREQRRLTAQGLGSISLDDGLQILGELLEQNKAQVGVLPINWSLFLQQFYQGVKSPFLETITSPLSVAKSIQLVNQVRNAVSHEERYTLLVNYLRLQVTKSLGLSQPDIQQPLNNLGLDSLMVIELRNYIRTQLGVELMIGTILTGASISELATEIELQLATTENKTNQTYSQKSDIIEQLPGHKDNLASQSSNNPKIILYCLPFAGGHTLSYRDFQAHVAESILIKPLELPGRGNRINEPGLTNLETMADDVFQQIQSDLNGMSYAIYGHSMGAILGYLLVKRILNAGKPAPKHLFVSGREAPSVVNDVPPIHQLPKQAFINQLNELGGLPPSIEGNVELMDFFEPILRADIQALETYIYQPTSPFDIPITILHGLTDKAVTYRNLLPWQQESTQPIAIHTLKGGHFFIFEQLSGLGQLFRGSIS